MPQDWGAVAVQAVADGGVALPGGIFVGGVGG